MSGNGLRVNYTEWATLGAEFTSLSGFLREAAQTLCQELRTAGPAWDRDDLGLAFVNGGGGKPGFETTLGEVMPQIADMVNALQYTGYAMAHTGGIFVWTEVAISREAGSANGMPVDVEKAVAEAAKGVQAVPAYKLPPFTGGTAENDKPPASWTPIVNLLEELTPYRPPDGSQAGLGSIAQALSTMANAIAHVYVEVRTRIPQIADANSGLVSSNFTEFADQLRLALEWLAEACHGLGDSAENLLLVKEAAWQQLGQGVAFLRQQEITLTAWAQVNNSGLKSEFNAAVREEGQKLLAERKTLDSDVLAGLPATPTSPVKVFQGQMAAANQRFAAMFG